MVETRYSTAPEPMHHLPQLCLRVVGMLQNGLKMCLVTVWLDRQHSTTGLTPLVPASPLVSLPSRVKAHWTP